MPARLTMPQPGLLDTVARLTAEFASVQREAAEALLDGDLAATEAATLDRALANLERQAETLRVLVLAKAGRKTLARMGGR